MKNIRDLHHQAMEFADQAFIAILHGKAEEAMVFSRQAFELEREAALELEADKNFEPTRAILFRSAATLALDCREPREAERLAAIGLAGNPPGDLADELREVFQRANAQPPKKSNRNMPDKLSLPSLLAGIKNLTSPAAADLVKAEAEALKQRLAGIGASVESNN
jgi:PHD/YefM family antitoxin component YafN of YafNO toxin-antitoxin module